MEVENKNSESCEYQLSHMTFGSAKGSFKNNLCNQILIQENITLVTHVKCKYCVSEGKYYVYNKYLTKFELIIFQVLVSYRHCFIFSLGWYFYFCFFWKFVKRKRFYHSRERAPFSVG